MGTKSIESENVVRGRRINFLGYCFTKDNVRMRKNMKKNFARKVKRIKSRKRNREIRASYWGWCKWGDCKNLWRTITNNDMSFADKGIKPVSYTHLANAADGSWDMPYVNSLLAEMNWFANGENISAISSWNGKYSIDTVGDTRGAITISRNVAPGESFELYFEGLIACLLYTSRCV